MLLKLPCIWQNQFKPFAFKDVKDYSLAVIVEIRFPSDAHSFTTVIPQHDISVWGFE